MIKTITFLKRKAGMTPEEFRSYYEANHVPLIEQNLPMISHYMRRYFTPAFNPTLGSVTELEYDAVNELWFESQEDFDALLAAASASPLKEIIAKDEAQFLDRDSIQSVIVSEVVSDMSGAATEWQRVRPGS